MNQIRMIKAVCDNCGNESMVKVPKRARIEEWHAANCDKCREAWEKQMDQIVKSMIEQVVK